MTAGPPSCWLACTVSALALCSTFRNGSGWAGRLRSSLRAGLNFQLPAKLSSEGAAASPMLKRSVARAPQIPRIILGYSSVIYFEKRISDAILANLSGGRACCVHASHPGSRADPAVFLAQHE